MIYESANRILWRKKEIPPVAPACYCSTVAAQLQLLSLHKNCYDFWNVCHFRESIALAISARSVHKTLCGWWRFFPRSYRYQFAFDKIPFFLDSLWFIWPFMCIVRMLVGYKLLIRHFLCNIMQNIPYRDPSRLIIFKWCVHHILTYFVPSTSLHSFKTKMHAQ